MSFFFLLCSRFPVGNGQAERESEMIYWSDGGIKQNEFIWKDE